ncbi:MAG: ribonuclease P protein component [Ignavibacteria bacterium]|nr:ribonuclease P protein component [Ignavibacteria bacterium]
MVKPGVLRGRTEFRLVLTQGKRLYGKQLRAAYLSADGPGEPARVGISVPRRIGNAVTRNRARRLIREAVRAEAAEILEDLRDSESRIDILLSFSPPKDVPLDRMSLRDFLPDVRKLFMLIADRTIRSNK